MQENTVINIQVIKSKVMKNKFSISLPFGCDSHLLKVETMDNPNHIFADRRALPDIIIHILSEDGSSTETTSIVEEAEEDYEDTNGGPKATAESRCDRIAQSVILWILRIFVLFLVVLIIFWFIWAPKFVYDYYYNRH